MIISFTPAKYSPSTNPFAWLLPNYRPITVFIAQLWFNYGSIMVQFVPTLFCHLLLKHHAFHYSHFIVLRDFAWLCVIMRNLCVIMRDNTFLHLHQISPINYIYQLILLNHLLQSLFETLLTLNILNWLFFHFLLQVIQLSLILKLSLFFSKSLHL